jgi:hypothetical protein
VAGKTANRVVLFLLVFGAAIFILLLAGLGSEALTTAKVYPGFTPSP